ncbi:hypothetical protein K8I61_11110 [bacterium]|nr:hypothetical protein [bacterium]
MDIMDRMDMMDAMDRTHRRYRRAAVWLAAAVALALPRPALAGAPRCPDHVTQPKVGLTGQCCFSVDGGKVCDMIGNVSEFVGDAPASFGWSPPDSCGEIVALAGSTVNQHLEASNSMPPDAAGCPRPFPIAYRADCAAVHFHGAEIGRFEDDGFRGRADPLKKGRALACPEGMTLIRGGTVRVPVQLNLATPDEPRRVTRRDVRVDDFCLDTYEASLDENGRAISRAGVAPATVVSKTQAQQALAAAGKTLPSFAEWYAACSAKKDGLWPWGGEEWTCNACNLHPPEEASAAPEAPSPQ